MTLLFVHGWGFDAGFWGRLAGLLPPQQTMIADLGYFGAPHDPVVTGPVVAVTHSFGTMRILREPPPGCRGLIAINGFDCFAERADKPGVPRRVINRMLARFDSDPAAGLSEFRRHCGTDEPFATPDAGRLRQDLLALRDMDCSAHAARWHLPILSLQGGRDQILPAAMREGVFASAPQVDRITHPTAGHLLPLTDPGYCARHISDFVERVR